MTKEVLEEVLNERLRQKDLAHGGNTEEFDQQNTRNDWIAYITAYAGRGADKMTAPRGPQEFRRNMVKVAALAVAAIEAVEKNYC